MLCQRKESPMPPKLTILPLCHPDGNAVALLVSPILPILTNLPSRHPDGDAVALLVTKAEDMVKRRAEVLSTPWADGLSFTIDVNKQKLATCEDLRKYLGSVCTP